MDELETLPNRAVSNEFAAHVIFHELDTVASAYEMLADLAFGFVSMTRPLLGNIDSFFFDSLTGTVESIKTVLKAGRIADAYTLLRRFNETTRLQVHVMLLLEKRTADLAETLNARTAEAGSEEFLQVLQQILQRGLSVEEVEKWLTGERSLKVEKPNKSGSATVEQVHFLFDRERYKGLLDRSNDHVHINFFRNLRLNAKISAQAQMTWLEQFAQDFRDLFVWHVAYIFTLHPEYMMSSDYVDALDCGATPDEDSQYWVAPVVQDVFDVVVTPHRPDVTEFLKQSTSMALA